MKTLICGIMFLAVTNISNAQLQSSSFMFDGLSREYLVFLPQNYEPDMPVVINLHGSLPNDDAQWLINYTLMNNIADTAGFIAVYPKAISPRWNTNCSIKTEPDVDDVGFISALIDTLNIHYDVDMNRIYCCGLNYGAWMASELICQIGNRFAAGARVNTSLGDHTAAKCKLTRPFPMILFNGTADTYLPWPDGKTGVMAGEEAIEWWVERNGCNQDPDTIALPDLDATDNCTVEKISYFNCAGNAEVIFYKVINGGLSWPGAVGNEPWDKPRNMDINAGVEILSFFRRFENPLTDMAYSKSVEVHPFHIQSPGDTITFRVEVYNPENHPVDVYAFIHGEEFDFEDSIRLYDDGLHDDGDSSDNIWGNMRFYAGLSEDTYKVDILTNDVELGKEHFHHLPARFITYGPVGLDHYIISPDWFCKDTVPAPGACLNLMLSLKNSSSMATATNLKVKCTSLCSLASLYSSSPELEDLAAGDTLQSKYRIQLWISGDCPVGTELPIEVAVSSFDHICWRDTFSLLVLDRTDVEEYNDPQIRIYPNPTSGLFTIETPTPERLWIEITSLNGQLMLNKEKEGTMNRLDLSSFQEGVYFITIRSKDFVTTRKIVKL